MSSQTVSSSNFQIILDAFQDYAKQTGVDLSVTNNPFADKIQSCHSPDAILELLQDSAKAFTEYREGNRKLISWLSPVVQVLHAFSGIFGEAVSLTPFQPAKAIFVCIDALLIAASGVSASYDALMDLFECIGNFLRRLHVYTEMTVTPLMSNIIVKIIVQVLSVLSLATKQIKQGRFKKFAKKLLGESEIEAVLQRLDRLTREEAQLTVVQTLQVVHDLMNNMKTVMDDGRASTDGIVQALVTMQETANEINRMKREQLQKDVRNWLSPPDPSNNHNIARDHHHAGTAGWFTRGSTFEKWKTDSSLLWIHGKPGSGKSILCSTVIQEVNVLHDAGLALMGYFYFDFRDLAKQDIRGLLTSLLSQFSAKSDSCHAILSNLYSKYNAGSQQPDYNTLFRCLKEMLELPRRPAIYIIVDALDECPNTSGLVSPRDRILLFLKDLVGLQLPNVHICVASRPEADIRDVLEPLTTHTVSLHDEGGQRNDIIDYINFVVQMQRWRAEDKNLVIDKLSQRADGMFRWVYCQLETLRRCFPAALRHALEELPETLDETYERTLLNIEKEKREYAQRIFQCLTVSVRPLRVEELVDVLAVRFDTGHIPQYYADWRPEDAQNAILSACSSLITVVNQDGSLVVQFSHFSVKEFLISSRLAASGEILSRFHILPEPAHAVLAQVSLSILLQLDDKVDKDRIKQFPLALYAAQHWVEHSKFGNVSGSSTIQEMMDRLFDPDKPYFGIWVWIYDIDYPWREHMSTTHPTQPKNISLYYAALCGFRRVAERLMVAHPQDMNTWGGYYGSALGASLAKGHKNIAKSLLKRGVDVDCQDHNGKSLLHRASVSGRRDVVVLLIEHGAKINIENERGEIPLFEASRNGETEVARILLGHGADVNTKNKKGMTPLMPASLFGHHAVVQLLLDSGASCDIRDNDGRTPLQLASGAGHLDVVKELLDRGADVNSQSNDGSTLLIAASANGYDGIVRLLLDSDASIDIRDKDGQTALLWASGAGHLDVVKELLDHGSDVNSQSNDGSTPLMFASGNGYDGIVRLLLDSGASIDIRDNDGCTALQLAFGAGHLDVVKELVHDGADVNIHDKNGWMPLTSASGIGNDDLVRLLFSSCASVDSCDSAGCTSLHFSANNGNPNTVTLLISHKANVDLRNNAGETAFDLASHNAEERVASALAEHMEAMNLRDSIALTTWNIPRQDAHLHDAQSSINHMGTSAPDEEIKEIASLHSATKNGRLDIVRSSLDRGADVNERDEYRRTPLIVASGRGSLGITNLLIERGAETNSRSNEGLTPLHMASMYGHIKVARLLLDHGAILDAREQEQRTPLHLAASFGQLEVVQLLLERGANVHVQNDNGRTPSQEALTIGKREIVRLLLEYEARGA